MYLLDKSVVTKWVQNPQASETWAPEGINVHCPFCAEKATFVPRTLYSHKKEGVTMTRAKCPTCGEQPFFFLMKPGSSDDRSEMGCEVLAMYPAPKLRRTPIEGSNLMPSKLREAYTELVDVFNAKAWRGTMTLCRVMLEAIVHDRLPNETGTLFERLKKLGVSPDLAAPILKLADLVRVGGNAGAHFDDSRTPNQDTATAMLQLTEYFLEYTYTLPRLVDDLDQHIKKLT